MSSFSLAPIKEVARLLEMMLGTGVSAKSVDAPMSPDASKVVGVYAADDGSIVSLCVVDLTLANYIGAALSMIPPGAAQDNVKEGALPENALNNLQEILNVCVNLTRVADATHVSFRNAIPPGEAIPEDVIALLSSQENRVDVEVEIDRYGAGMMALCALSESAVPAT